MHIPICAGISCKHMPASMALNVRVPAQAQGRATVEMNIKLKETRNDGVSGGTLKIVADGYNAPVTAGNFIDLVQRGFYNNMEIQRADGFVVQTGDPGPEQARFCRWK